MKNLLPYLVVLLFLMPTKIFAQKVIYFNRGFEKVKSIKTADFYQVAEKRDDKKYTITRYSADSVLVMRGVATETYFWGYDGDFIFYNHGHKRSEGVYKKDRKEGMWKYYNDSGALEKERFYRNGSLDSIEINYYTSSGRVLSETKYQQGTFVSDMYFDENGREVPRNFRKVITKPETYKPAKFKGDLNQYFDQNIAFPEEAFEGLVQNMALMSLVIDTAGKVTDFDIIKSVSPLFDHALVRVFSMMPDWEPATQDGKPVDYPIFLPYRFTVQVVHINTFLYVPSKSK